MAWTNDLAKSIGNFERYILPVLPKLVRGKYIRVEGTLEEIAEMLDKRVGIDAMIDQGDLVYGLGSRIQIDSGVWNTFTIRMERESGNQTELEKLRKAILNDSMRPHLTLHAYIENGKLQSVAVARTRDIIEYIDTHDCPVRRSWDADTQKWAQFAFVYWRDMIEAGYRVVALDYRSKGGRFPLAARQIGTA